ncbi:Type IV pilin PilA [Desulfovibrio sp. TomC]|nr:Type IV pilin PilA [Desulfovibrio sp. TomC]
MQLRAAGFSLIEIIAVLVLLGLLALAVINRPGTKGTQAIVEADALRAALRYAQSRAMADVYTWGISISSGSYQLVEDNPNVNGGILPGQSSNSRTLPTGVTLSGANLVLFDSRGQPVTANIAVIGGASVTASTNQYINVTETPTVQTVTVTPYTGLIP